MQLTCIYSCVSLVLLGLIVCWLNELQLPLSLVSKYGCMYMVTTSGVARGGGLRGLEHPPLRWSEYAVNGSGQQAATA